MNIPKGKSCPIENTESCSGTSTRAKYYVGLIVELSEPHTSCKSARGAYSRGAKICPPLFDAKTPPNAEF
jgi:hypothetical protein